jgi:hypothetical protein
MRNRLLGLVSALAVVTGPMHRADAQTPSLQALVGSYRLLTIDGHAIPFAPVHPDTPANALTGPEVIASTMVVRPDGSFIMAMGYRSTAGDTQHFMANPFSGTCAVDGNGYVARWDGAGQTRLTLTHDTLVVQNEGMLFTYRKTR